MGEPWTTKLRDWQTRAVQHALTRSGQDFLCMATPAAGERDFFGERPAGRSEYEAVSGVARQDRLIGDHDEMSANTEVAEETPQSLHQQKDDLRGLHRTLVGVVARKTGEDHRTINGALCRQTGGPIDRATMAQLKKRLWLLETWKDAGRIG
jgi:hypothetical protein